MSGATSTVAVSATAPSRRRRVLALRIAIVVTVLALWQIVSVSGWLFRDVVPSLTKIALAIFQLLTNPDFYSNLGVTGYEIAVAIVIGGLSGLAVGIALGANRFLSDAKQIHLHGRG